MGQKVSSSTHSDKRKRRKRYGKFKSILKQQHNATQNENIEPHHQEDTSQIPSSPFIGTSTTGNLIDHTTNSVPDESIQQYSRWSTHSFSKFVTTFRSFHLHHEDEYTEDFLYVNDIEIPIHVFLNVFVHLNVDDVCHCMLVNSQWYDIIDRNEFWHQLCLEWFGQQDSSASVHPLFSTRDMVLPKNNNDNNDNSNNNNNNNNGSPSSHHFLFKSWKDLAVLRFMFYEMPKRWGELIQIEDVIKWREHSGVICKVCIVGQASSGKSSLLNRFIDGEFSEDILPTVGVDFFHRIVHMAGVDLTCKLQIWSTGDTTATSPHYYTIYTRGASIIVLTFDLGDALSFTAIEQGKFYSLIENEFGEEAIYIVLGLKSDLKVDNELSYRALDFCARHGLVYFECSAKNQPESVIDAFNVLSRYAVQAIVADENQRTCPLHLMVQPQKTKLNKA